MSDRKPQSGIKMRISRDWLRRKIETNEDIPACQYCGAMAGVCDAYPHCPSGTDSQEIKDE